MLHEATEVLRVGAQPFDLPAACFDRGARILELSTATFVLGAKRFAVAHQVRSGLLEGGGARQQGIPLASERANRLVGFLEALAELGYLHGAPALGFVARLVALAELFLGRAQAVELGTQAVQVGAECRSGRFRLRRPLLELGAALAELLLFGLRQLPQLFELRREASSFELRSLGLGARGLSLALAPFGLGTQRRGVLNDAGERLLRDPAALDLARQLGPVLLRLALDLANDLLTAGEPSRESVPLALRGLDTCL